METEFEKRIAALINEYSKENESSTPDFILARYLNEVLKNFNAAVMDREQWYGRIQHVEDNHYKIPFDFDGTSTPNPNYLNGTGGKTTVTVATPDTFTVGDTFTVTAGNTINVTPTTLQSNDDGVNYSITANPNVVSGDINFAYHDGNSMDMSQLVPIYDEELMIRTLEEKGYVINKI